MDKRQRFEDFLAERNDELDNAAYGLAQQMLSANGVLPSEDEFPWNMEIIGAILDAAEDVLNEKGYHPCWPYHENEDTPCYVLEDCKHKDCPLKK